MAWPKYVIIFAEYITISLSKQDILNNKKEDILWLGLALQLLIKLP